MILTRSPYYLTIDWTQGAFGSVPERYVIQLYIWNGLKASVPAEPTYEIENKNPLSRTGSVDVNISNYINDVLDYSLIDSSVKGSYDANAAVWVKSQVIYYINDVAQTPYYVTTNLALNGYGYGIEGSNTTIPVNNVLSNVNFANVSNNTTYLLPIVVDEVDDVVIDVVSLPDNTINDSIIVSSTTNSNELIKQIIVKCSEIGTDTSIQIKYDTVVVHTLILKDEPRYTPIDIIFLNKSGQLQTTTFFKEKTESLSTTNEKYESSQGQPLNGVHQMVTYNKNGKKDFKINSGWVKESYNEIFTQLFLSNDIWQLKDDIYIPLNLKSKNLQYQTRQRERLLNYELEFEYAFNEINNA